MARERIHDASDDELRVLFGPLDRHLRGLRERFGVRGTLRHDVLLLEGGDARVLAHVTRRVKQVLARLRKGEDLSEDQVERALLDLGEEESPPTQPGVERGGRHMPGGMRPTAGPPGRPAPGRSAGGEIRPKTPNQERYVRAIRHHDVVFAVGPAGTGKTFLAVVEAVN